MEKYATARSEVRVDSASSRRLTNGRPRILFLGSEPPHSAAAGSIYFYRLFADWKEDQFLVVTHDSVHPRSQRLPCRYEHISLPLDRLQRTRFWKWRTAVRVLGATNLVPLRKIERAVGSFEPEVIVTLMQDSWMYDTAARYATRIRKPLVVFVHDLAHGFEPLPAILRQCQFRRDRALFNRASLRFCVSAGMAQYLHDHFRVEASVLLPPRSPDPVGQNAAACQQLKVPGRLTLGYAGGLHYGYGEQLLTMVPVLREAGAFLQVFGAAPLGKLSALSEATDVIRFHGRLTTPEKAWQEILKSCDAVILPYLNPPGPHHLQYQTHFPSKLGDCLALGLPLLVTGPADATGMKWCLEHPGCAICVTDHQSETLVKAIRELRDNPELREIIAQKAGTLGAEFNSNLLRDQFQKSVARIAWRQ